MFVVQTCREIGTLLIRLRSLDTRINSTRIDSTRSWLHSPVRSAGPCTATTPIVCVAWREGIPLFRDTSSFLLKTQQIWYSLYDLPREGLNEVIWEGIFFFKKCPASPTASPLMDLREADFSEIEINMLYFKYTDLSITWFFFLLHVGALLTSPVAVECEQ
jgi:hypothetical protein